MLASILAGPSDHPSTPVVKINAKSIASPDTAACLAAFRQAPVDRPTSTKHLRRMADDRPHDTEAVLIWINVGGFAARCIHTPKAPEIDSRRIPFSSREPNASTAQLYIRLYFSRDIRALCFAIIGMATRPDYNHEIARLQIGKSSLCASPPRTPARARSESRTAGKKQRIVSDPLDCLKWFACEFSGNTGRLRIDFRRETNETPRIFMRYSEGRRCVVRGRISFRKPSAARMGLDESTMTMSSPFVMRTCDSTRSAPAYRIDHRDLRPYATDPAAWPDAHAHWKL
jgi:hypothetical protein